MTRAKRKRAAPASGSVENLGEALALVGAMIAIDLYRPRRREDCLEAARPCPFVRCKFNLLIEVTDKGEIVLNSGQADDDRGEGAGRLLGARVSDAEFHRQVDAHIEWWRQRADRARRRGTRMPESCVDDVVRKHHKIMMGMNDAKIDALGLATGLHLETVGEQMFITRERARQLEAVSFKQLRQLVSIIRRRLYAGAAVFDSSRRAEVRDVVQRAVKREGRAGVDGRIGVDRIGAGAVLVGLRVLPS